MFGETELKQQIEEAFGGPLTAKQLWAMTNFAKRVRLRARNNAAYNNLAGRLFPHARFQQVNKQRADGSTYPGLQITVGTETASGDEDE